jgi:hypothetical protein
MLDGPEFAVLPLHGATASLVLKNCGKNSIMSTDFTRPDDSARFVAPDTKTVLGEIDAMKTIHLLLGDR